MLARITIKLLLCCILSQPLISDYASTATLYAGSAKRLRVEIAGYPGGECYSHLLHTHLAGSVCTVVLDIFGASGGYRGLPSEPPEGLQLSACVMPFDYKYYDELNSEDLQSFNNSSDLLNRLSLEFYVDISQVNVDTLHRAGVNLMRDQVRPKFYFKFTIPEDLAGYTLCIKAEINSSEFGHLENMDCKRIVEPCSKKDIDQIVGTNVSHAYRSQDYEHCVELADSLIGTGWSWEQGLRYAGYSAKKIGNHEKELLFLDTRYNAFGRVTLTSGPLDQSKEEAEYQRRRQKILDQISQQDD